MLEPRLAAEFQRHVLSEVDRVKGRGYDPRQFLAMVEEFGAVGAAKRLLGDPRRTSYGFARLWELRELGASVEFAACLPWFEDLFTEQEREEAARRLVLHDFPLDEQLARHMARPPQWTNQ